MRIAGTDFSYGAFALLVVHAARGCRQAIQALFLSWLFVSLNQEIIPPIGDVELIRMGILVAAGARAAMAAFNRGNPLATRGVIIPLVFFVGICLVNSMLASQLPSLSVLKALLFGLMAFATIGIWARSGLLREWVEAWFFNALAVIALLSAPLALIGMGYERNDYGFQGILNQPQGFGIMMALLTAWQLGKMLTRRLYSVLQVLLLTFFAALLYMSASRTGMLAFMLGTLAAGAMGLFSSRPELRAVLTGIPPFLRLAAAATLTILSIVFFQGLVQGVQQVVFKGDAESSLAENFAGSRGELIDASFENFKERPIFGKGFGIPSYFDEFAIRYDPIFGLPVSAPVEKGVLPVAVLEELGVVGGLFFLWLIYALLHRVARNSEYRMIGLLVCALAINLGEAVLFSAGGFGLLVWLVIGMALAPTTATGANAAVGRSTR